MRRGAERSLPLMSQWNEGDSWLSNEWWKCMCRTIKPKMDLLSVEKTKKPSSTRTVSCNGGENSPTQNATLRLYFSNHKTRTLSSSPSTFSWTACKSCSMKPIYIWGGDGSVEDSYGEQLCTCRVVKLF